MQVFKKMFPIHGTGRFITTSTAAFYIALLKARWIQSTLSFFFIAYMYRTWIPAEDHRRRV